LCDHAVHGKEYTDNSGDGGDNMILNLLWCGDGDDDYNDVKFIVVLVMMIIVLNLLWWS